MRSSEGQVAQVVSVEVKEVEGEVGEGMLGAFLKGGLQVGEAGGAVGGEDDDFAVEDGGVGGEGLRPRQRWSSCDASSRGRCG